MNSGKKTGFALLAAVAVIAALIAWTHLTRRPAPVDPAAAAADGESRPATATSSSVHASYVADPGLAPSRTDSHREQLLALLREKILASAAVDEIQALLNSIAATNSALALDLAQTIARDDGEKYHFTAGILRVWARTDPEAACRWAFQQSDQMTVAGEPSLGNIAISQMAATDPQAMLAWVNSALQNSENADAPDALNGRQVAGAAVDALLKMGYTDLAKKTVEQWAKNPDHPEIGNTAFESVALEMAKNSPGDAAAWLLSLPPGSDRNYALGTLASTWTDTDAKSAMDTAYNLSEGDGRADVMERAFNHWSQKDLPAATEWLDQHQSDPAAVRMVADLVNESGLAYSNPQVALAWAEWIPDPDLRLQSIEQTVIDWARRDPENARQYVQNNPKLTAAQKAQVLESMHGWKNMTD